MKFNVINKLFYTSALAGVLLFSGCSEDDDAPVTPIEPTPTGQSKTYQLEERNNSGVSGTVTFTELDDSSVRATIDIEGTSAGTMHPAHIHENSAAEGGGIAVGLTSVDGATGMSETIITDLTYAQILEYDGYVNVHLSDEDLTVVAQQDIGSNELTSNSKTYTFIERVDSGVNGTVTFTERNSGEVYAIIEVTGTEAGNMHPAHIHENSFAEGGAIAVGFNPVDGATGISRNNITDFTFEELMNYDGYVNIHLSSEDLTVVAQQDIGSNELTGTEKVYTFNEIENSGVTGTITFSERNNGLSLATIMLDGTVAGMMHPAHIHENSAEEGGGIVYTFNPVNGDTGMSFSNVDLVPYTELLDYDGYVNVHLSMEQLEVVVAQVNIGSNE